MTSNERTGPVGTGTGPRIEQRVGRLLNRENRPETGDRQVARHRRRADILGVAWRLGLRARLKRTGGGWIGPCPRCGGHDRFSINPAKQLWNCRGCGVGGDAIDLLRHLTGSSFVEAAQVVDGAPRSERQVQPHDHAALVRRIVSRLVPILGTPAEAYLREVRRIDVSAITDILERTDAIGWHPAVFFSEPGHPLHRQLLGCIVGVMTDPVTALPTGAISRTYLDPEGRKVAPAKTLGSPAGIVRLSPDDEVTQGLHRSASEVRNVDT
jgi:hypothetical protein